MNKGRFADKKGFTLLEVLIGVGVLVILLAVSIPSIITASRDLNMTKLDAAAKEVFTAAQNRLTAMKASGELSEFTTTLNSSYSDRSLTAFMTQPADYPEGDSGWQSFYFLTSDDPVFLDFVMSDMAFQAIDGRYIVELNPDTGDVFSVFYGEYADGVEFANTYKTYAYFSRSGEDREAVAMGYYSGSDMSAPVLPNSFQPSVTVHNNEELYLEVSCADMLQFSATRQYLTLKLTMTDEHGGTWEKEYNGLDDLTIVGGEIRLYVLIDSMRQGSAFHDLLPELNAGDDITAVATMEYSYRGKDVTTDPEYRDNTRMFNSLFDSVTDTSGSDTINISKLRHLNNLRSSIFATSDNPVGQVLQIAPIYFDSADWAADEWCPATESKTQPLSAFTPLVNDTLFGSSSAAGSATFQGGELHSMVIGNGAAQTGLFAHPNCDISGCRLIDPAVNGASYTGALAGRVYGGNISGCGVYLTSANESGVLYDEATMAARMAQFCVHGASGSTNLGGLIGAAQGNTHIEQSFAAIDVNGSLTNAGGFIGSFSGTAIDHCYSSGDVAVNAHVGGFTGNLMSGSITNCSTTSNVVAGSYAGGFAGDAAGGQITNCIAYGATRKSDGTTDIATSGGFVGSGGAAFTNDSYLRQNGYNSDYDKQTKRNGIEPVSYTLLKADPANSPSNSFPYYLDLQGKAYPFQMLTGSHYGNWPQEATIETSLIYYEKYTNSRGSVAYGYYADGFAKTGDGSAVSAWNLNTLRSQAELDSNGYWLTEDGYALLSIYNLVQFKYTLNTGSQVTVNVNTSPGSNRFVLMENPSSLPLSAIDKDTGLVIGQFSVNYLYIFQLPFELQETNRDATFTFYDRLLVTGYAKGNPTDSVFADYVFYYCPHFAKNAINPDVNQNDPGRPHYSQNPTIYVRSARQLNALGRYSYYWSKVNAPYSAFIFTQGLDINFSTYSKSFCGRTFDLTNTLSTNSYRNRPIGKPMAQSFTDPWGDTYRPGNFQNVYNGNCYKIIDYRQHCYANEDIQFAGLFGEIMNATITNVNMIASTPGSPGSGYIISEYNSSTGRSAGIGALVGLSYAENKAVQCTISNCSVSGYAVVYYNMTSGGVLPNNVSTGGLIGYNMGIVTNCSADSFLVAAQINDANSKLIIVSGLIGSCTNGSVSNCYAGGSLEMTVSKEQNANSSINGLSQNSYVWAPYGNGTFTVQNCYSFCTINSKNYAYKVYGCGGATTNTTDFSTGSFSSCYYLTDSINPNVTVTTKTIPDSTPRTYNQLAQLALAGFGSATAPRTYPWSTSMKGLAYPFPAVVKNANGDYVHYGDWPARLPQPVYLTYYEKYSNGSIGVYFYDENNPLGVATDTIRNDSTIVSNGYGLLRMKNPNFDYITRFEDAYGQPIALETDVGTLGEVSDANGVKYQLFAFTDASTNLLATKVDNALTPEQALNECTLRTIVNFVAEDGQQGDDKLNVVYVNPRFARAIQTVAECLGKSDICAFDVRTARQLCAVPQYGAVHGLFFKQTRDLNAGSYVPANAVSYIDALGANSTYNGGNFSISGATLPIFAQNNGTVSNVKLSGSTDALVVTNVGTLTGCTVTNSTISKASGACALLVCTNTGTVSACTVKDSTLTLTGSATGAPAIAVNAQTITNVTVSNCTVTGPTAAGFVYNNNSGTISACAVTGTTVTSQSTAAAGFAFTNAASITGCAAVRTNVTAQTRASGFVEDFTAGSITDCYVAPGISSETWNGKGYSYATVQIKGASAFGFAGNSMGTASKCFAVATVKSTAGNAAGFGENANNTSYCFANCAVEAAGTNAISAGFAINAINTTHSYACGSVAGPASYGFLYDGNSTVSYCYTICSLPTNGVGFAPSTRTMGGDCYWVKDARSGYDFNTAVSETCAGTVKTFYELSKINSLFIGNSAANPFIDSPNGTTYYYAVVGGLNHMGGWPKNPGGSYIGIVRVAKTWSGGSYKYNYTYRGWNCATADQDTINGPAITWSESGKATRYYLYYSNDLSPALNAPQGWTYSTNTNAGVSTVSANSGDYTIYIVTYNDKGTVRFYLDNNLMFRVRYYSNSSTIDFYNG